MPGVRGGEMKTDTLASLFAEMQNVRTDMAGLKELMDVPLCNVDSKMGLNMRSDVNTLLERIDAIWNEVKGEVEGMRAQATRLQVQLGNLQRAEEDEDSSKEERKTQLKRILHPSAGEKKMKRARQRLPQLPADVVLRVLKHTSVPDIGNSRKVCRMWRQVIDTHDLELWKDRCHELGMFPPEGTDTVLGRSARRTRLRIDTVRKEESNGDVRRKLVNVYKEHYETWIRHICRRCQPSGLRCLNTCCTHPSDFKWLDLNFCMKILNNPSFIVCFGGWEMHNFGTTQVGFELIDERTPDSLVSRRADAYEDAAMTVIRKDIFVQVDALKDSIVKQWSEFIVDELCPNHFHPAVNYHK